MKKELFAFLPSHIVNPVAEKFKEITSELPQIGNIFIVEDRFKVSGYSKIRKQLKEFGKIQILVGIDTAELFRKYSNALHLLHGNKTERQAKAIYAKNFKQDIGESAYFQDIENSVELMCEDLISGKLELRIHTTFELKTNLCLISYTPPPAYTTLWHALVGAENLTDTGMSTPKFAMNMYSDNLEFAQHHKGEFDKIWRQGLPITIQDIESFKSSTHLVNTPSAHDLYMKVLIDYYGSQVDNKYKFALPGEFKELKYQIDAVNQGYEMLIRHNGFFLADVVGLGKTVVAALLAKRFVNANDARITKTLVIYPPSVEDNWKDTFELFGLTGNTHFVSIGNLHKVLKPDNGYLPIEEYCLILADEAHRYRNTSSEMFGTLQLICKSHRNNIGGIKGLRKKVVLISATPLNNRPDDLYNLLRLFQNTRNSSINGIANLQKYFTPKIAEYKKIMNSRGDFESEAKTIVEQVNTLYDSIRRDVLDQVTVRRTRENLMNNDEYKTDLEKQGIIFPVIERPREVGYNLDGELKDLFGETMDILTGRLKYARYKAVERLTAEYADKFPRGVHTSRLLSVLYRTHMVKRLESSFEAFRTSLGRLLYATDVMIRMFERDKVIIAPDLKINKLQAEGWSFDEIIEEGAARFGISPNDFVYPASAFDPVFLQELHEDARMIRELIGKWEGVDFDPKFDKLVRLMNDELFDLSINPTGKLVIFSESKDTVLYLEKMLKEALGRNDILAISSENRARLRVTINENFDANYKSKKNDYNIVISTDALSEGVNLHRSNMILSYDTPWNATRLMQRIGRVNRIGSVAGSILNYLFYPSAEGNAQINLYQNALAKLQGFHAALGEDSQIYSLEEVVRQFELFNPCIGDDEDKRTAFLSELREFYNDYPKDYERIKNLPAKSRLNRIAELNIYKGIPAKTSLVYINSSYKASYYQVFDVRRRRAT